MNLAVPISWCPTHRRSWRARQRREAVVTKAHGYERRLLYYSATDGVNLNHAMSQYTLPRGNGMHFEYYVNGRVFRHTTTLGESNVSVRRTHLPS